MFASEPFGTAPFSQLMTSQHGSAGRQLKLARDSIPGRQRASRPTAPHRAVPRGANDAGERILGPRAQDGTGVEGPLDGTTAVWGVLVLGVSRADGRFCCAVMLWMDEILHHPRSHENHCLLAFTGES